MHSPLTVLLCLLAACSVLPRSELEAPHGQSVLLPTRDCGLHFLVDAWIDGRGPYTLMLDSGASSTLLDPNLPMARGGTFRVSSIEIGPLKLLDHEVQAHELDHLGRALGEPVHGILGWPAFADLLVTFDYPAREVHLARGTLPDPDGQQVFACSATSGPYLNMEVGPETYTFLVDTGSNGGVSFNTLADEHFQEPPRVVSAVAVHEGLYLKRAGRLRYDLLFGTTVLREPVVGFTDQISIVGARVLREFRVTFDANSARMRLEYSGQGPIEFESRRGLGLAFATEADGLRVVYVLPDGPAAAAGLALGDLIVRLAGRDPLARSCESLLRREDLEQPMPLTVMRDGRALEFAIEIEVLVR